MPRTGRPKTPLELTGEEREQLPVGAAGEVVAGAGVAVPDHPGVRRGAGQQDRRGAGRLFAEHRDQCVAFSGVDSSVATTTSSTCDAVTVAGRPGRGSSVSPSKRASRNRARHLLTVVNSRLARDGLVVQLAARR